ncbi:hypothetical protein HYDPIDRAFT_107055 [Hydnomerulius pinastri MD-312]|nr:hypothetical protein HYDPIDRAFT_107055 [Hydnomerulius pinastri MD-312]
MCVQAAPPLKEAIAQPQAHAIRIDTTVVLLPPMITNLLATINRICAAAIDVMGDVAWDSAYRQWASNVGKKTP